MTAPPPLMRREGEGDRKPWGLIIALLVALMVGAGGLPLQFLTYRQIGEASKAEQLRRGQQALCEQINQIAVQANLRPFDCSTINQK
jgi:hypothetical protein